MKNNPTLPPVFAAIEARTYGCGDDFPPSAFFPFTAFSLKISARDYAKLHADYAMDFYYEQQWPDRYCEGYILQSTTYAEYKKRCHGYRVYMRKNEVSCGSIYTNPNHIERGNRA